METAGRIEIIRELCSFEGRLTGTDAERRAANHLAKRLRGQGRRVEVEPIHVHPQVALIYAAHCALGFAASLIAIASPGIGFAIALLAATSMYLDLNARFYLLRRLFFRRVSQNVVAKGGRPEAAARVLLAAHIDAARTGAAYSERRIRLLTRVIRALPFTFSPPRLLFWSLAILVPILGLRAAGLDSNLISLLQLPPTLVLLVGVFALVDIELSEVVPGANDDASGVATALSVAEQLDADQLQNLDVWVVLTGGEECGFEGMRSFLRAHRRSLDPAATWVVCLDAVGRGDVRYATGEGMAVTFDYRSRLTELCEAIALADREDSNRYRAAALRHGFATDSLPARLRRMRTTTITCLEPGAAVPANYHAVTDVPDAVDRGALDRAHGFTLELVRALDRDLGRRAPGAGIQAAAGGRRRRP